MPLAKYVFKPGINREGTNYSNEGGWFDADKVRFRKGRPERIGGWQKQSLSSFIGTCRKIYPYKATDGSDYITLGTHQKFYVLEGQLELVIVNTDDCEETIICLEPGDTHTIKQCVPHKLESCIGCKLIEVSTFHDDKDSYRILK